MRVLIVGYGSIGKKHAKSLGNNKNDITVFSRNKSYDNEGLKTINKWSDLNKEFFNGIIIATPTSLHFEHAKFFFERDVPIFVEKPISNDVSHLESWPEKIHDNILVGNNLNYHSGYKKMKLLLEKETIGKIYNSKIEFGTYMPNWHPNEDYKTSYAANSNLGGGVTLTSIHEISYLMDFFGGIEDLKVYEIKNHFLDIDVDCGIECIFRHKNGIISNLYLSFFQQPMTRRCFVIGSKGTIKWDLVKCQILVSINDEKDYLQYDDSYEQSFEKSYHYQMEHFMDMMEKSVKPQVPLSVGARDLDIAIKILKKIGR